MRKIITVLCAVSMFAFTACSSDDEGSPTTPPIAQGTSGTIGSINVNGFPYEVWNWDDTALMSVTNATNGQEKVHFGYDGYGRVNTVTFSSSLDVAGIPLNGIVRLHYNEDKLALVKMTRNGADLFSAAIEYSGNQITHATVDLSDSMLLTVFNSVASQILGNAMGTDGNFPTINDVSTEINLDWTGNNVTSLHLSSDILATTTVAELDNLVDDFSIFGSYGALLELAAVAMPNMEIFFNITLGDTSVFTYDNNKNPYQGYMGQLDVSTLSANNVLTKTVSRGVEVKVSNELMGTLLERSYPLSPENVIYTYNLYNQGGYPVKVSANNGEVREYHYKE